MARRAKTLAKNPAENRSKTVEKRTMHRDISLILLSLSIGLI